MNSRIPFPKMHIAQSVLNRIANALEDKESPFMPMPEPPAPLQPAINDMELNNKLSEPVVQSPPAMDDMQEEAAANESMLGGSPLTGVLAQ